MKGNIDFIKFYLINTTNFNVHFIYFSFKDYVKKNPKNKILETVKFLELRKEVLAEIKEADAKKNQRKIDSGSDSDDMADPMEQVIHEMKVKIIINFNVFF